MPHVKTLVFTVVALIFIGTLDAWAGDPGKEAPAPVFKQGVLPKLPAKKKQSAPAAVVVTPKAKTAVKTPTPTPDKSMLSGIFIAAHAGGNWIQPDLDFTIDEYSIKARSKRGLAYGGEAGWQNKNWRFNLDVTQSGNDLSASQELSMMSYDLKSEWESKKSSKSIDANARLSMTQVFVEATYKHLVGAGFGLYGGIGGGLVIAKLTDINISQTSYGKTQSARLSSDSVHTWGVRLILGADYKITSKLAVFVEGTGNYTGDLNFNVEGNPVPFGHAKTYQALGGVRYTF